MLHRDERRSANNVLRLRHGEEIALGIIATLNSQEKE